MATSGFFDPTNNVDVTDALSEILLRVDPSSIFNCALVSREWLKVITGTVFRQDYVKLWKNHPKFLMVVGFFMYEYGFIDNLRRSCSLRDRPAVQFLPTNKLGRIINGRKTMAHLGYFISKSSDNGLVLSGVHPKNWYVSHPISGLLLQLPSPSYPKRSQDKCMANIVSDDPLDPFSFKVIIAEASAYPGTNTLVIQTYYSSTRKWVQSTLTCSTHFSLFPATKVDAGTVTRAGVIYWRASVGRLAVYDTQTQRLSLILEPRFAQYYGVSPQGTLRCATLKAVDSYNDEKSWEEGMIGVWDLDDDNKRDWKLLYEVDLKSVWAENSLVLGPLFKAGKPRRPFYFVSFVPGKSDSIFVGLGKEFFVYNFDTHKLERMHHSYKDGYGKPIFKFSPGCFVTYHPVTLQEVGAWPQISFVPASFQNLKTKS